MSKASKKKGKESPIAKMAEYARATRKSGESWPAAMKRSNKELKESGKI